MCGKDFYSKGRMRTHQLSHNKDKAFKCSLCSVYVSNVNALERHINNSHTKKYKCDICKKEYKSKKALHNHESVRYFLSIYLYLVDKTSDGMNQIILTCVEAYMRRFTSILQA